MTNLQWQTPEPLWARFGPDAATAVAAADQARPALLRFASDEFMDQLLATLARDPASLGGLLAAPESWRAPLSDPPDLIERVPIPGTAAMAARGRALGRAPTALPPVTASRTVAEQARTRTLPLKLFQPAHQRYYLVCASLVCAALGMPDRAVTRGGAEQVGFVLRRLLPADAKPGPSADPLHEYAFVKAADQTRWQRVSATDQDAVLVPGEEVLPLFPLAFADRAARRRTLWTGLIPVGRREEYLGAAVVTTSAPPLAEAQRGSLAPAVAAVPSGAKTARLTQFQMEVAEPWKALIRSVFQAQDALAETLDRAEETNEARTTRIQDLNLQWQMQSWLILLDLADFLALHLPQVWQAIQDRGASAAALGPASGPGRTPQRALYEWLGTAANPAALAGAIGAAPRKAAKAHLREALIAIRQPGVREGLEGAATLYTEATKGAADWPGFHFLLAGLDGSQSTRPVLGLRADPQAAGALAALTTLDPVPAADQPIPLPPAPAGETTAAAVDRLTALIEAALTPAVETKAPPLPFALQLRDALAATAGDAGWFVVRCVHLDRDCGPLYPPTLSAPTVRFQLASFFDPDAPARPVRISLPADTSPAGLRRHSRGTAFVLSDMLCGQLQRAKGLGLVDLVRSVLPWPLHKDLNLGSGGGCQRGDGIDIGMICSLSIPIVTICALILLIIMVSLLDFIFRWLPYFIFCFPLPKLKGKPEAP